jgi:hypothetical protein
MGQVTRLPHRLWNEVRSMNRFTLGLVVPITLLVAAGCSGDPTSNLRNGIDHIEAAPTQLFIEPGNSKTVEVSGVDEQGNQLDLAFDVAAGSGITVKRDSTFHPVYVNDTLLAVPPTATRWRFIVTAVDYGQTSFTVTSGGKNIQIPVQVIPQSTLLATFSDSAPAFGDTVTLTAAPGTTFADTAALLIGGDATRPLTIVARAADGSSISFIAPPNIASPITITSVSSTGAPTLTFSPSTASVLRSTVIDTVDVNFSTATPTIGQTVTMSNTNPLIKFDTTVASVSAVPVLIFPGQLTGPAPGPAAIALSADSSSLSFQAPPNANGPAAVTSFAFPGGYTFPLPTRTGIATTPVLSDTVDITVSNLNPNVLDPITISLPANVRWEAADDSVIIGGQSAIVQSVAVGGASIDVIPLPGSIGRPRLVGVFPTGFPQFSLSLQGDDSVTVPPLTPLEGTDDPATAPTIPVPGTLVDAGTFGATACGQVSGFACQIYKFTLAAGGTHRFTLSGPGPADLGLYFLNADLSDNGNVCDSLGNNSPPEDCNLTFAAGTYYMMVISFGPAYVPPDPNPPFIQVVIQ